ncbi:MAG TPA: hypothetical protein PLW43_00080 [Chitinophagales bacterium]|nr:hypothetical protein [Chitinophagales bacterium]HQO31739.1 hypothetical protein [Chitinophagales bacterium]
MSAAELKEKKELIIQEIRQVEDEWILKAIEKLLDINSDENKELESRMRKRISGESKSHSWEEVDSELDKLITKK